MRAKTISRMLMTVCLLTAVSCAQDKQSEPSVFSVSRQSSTVPTADAGSVSFACKCDIKWSARLKEGSWARISNISSGSDGSGSFDVAYDFNPSGEAREDSIIVISGSRRFAAAFRQMGITSVVSATNANITGSEGAKINVTTQAAWTAEADETKAAPSWFDFEPKSSQGGPTPVTIRPLEHNYDKQERSALIRFRTSGTQFYITVTQKPTDAILLSSDKVDIPYKGGIFNIEVRHNVSYTCNISTVAESWISHESTKAPDLSTETFSVKAHSGNEPRSGEIYFYSGAIKETVTVYQAETGILILSTSNKTVAYGESSFEVSLRSNILYTWTASVPWLSIDETKSVRTDIKTVAVAANDSDSDRTGTITFKDADSDLSATLTVTQMSRGDKEYMSRVVPGIYGFDADLSYHRFDDQLLLSKDDGSRRMCILNDANYTYIDISGIPQSPVAGSAATLSIKQNASASLSPTMSYEAQIDKVSDELVWLSSPDNIFFIVRIQQ